MNSTSSSTFTTDRDDLGDALEVVQHARDRCRRRAPAAPLPNEPRTPLPNPARRTSRPGMSSRSAAEAVDRGRAERIPRRGPPRSVRPAPVARHARSAARSPGSCSRGPVTAATPGSRPMSCSQAGELWPAGRPMPGCTRSISVGARIPGAKPCCAGVRGAAHLVPLLGKRGDERQAELHVAHVARREGEPRRPRGWR